jgi:protein TonB
VEFSAMTLLIETMFMQTNLILSADILDILFDDRNKEYGAYDLRKHYNKRMVRSFLTMFIIVLLLLLAYFLFSAMRPADDKRLAGPDVILDRVPPLTEKPKPMIIPPTPKVDPPKIKTLQYTVPKITDNPPPEEQPPKVEDLEKAKISISNQSGSDDVGLVGPVNTDGKGIVDAPKKLVQDDAPFTRVEIESEYPGGRSAWAAFLNRNLAYPEAAVENGVQGTVLIQFIVDVAGNVSDVKAISGPAELHEEAIRVIKKSGKWTAAIQNGQKVKSYKTQPITFKLDTGG